MHNLYILFNAHCTYDRERIFKSIHEYSLVTIRYTCHKGVKLHKLYLICKKHGHKLIVGLAYLTSMEYELKVLHNSLKEKQD